VAQEIESHLASVKLLSSNPSATKKKKEEKGHAIQEGESNLGERREVKGRSRIRAAYQARAFISSGRRRIESSRGMSLRKVTAEGTDLENTMLRG
jgi:hypothetical protein